MKSLTRKHVAEFKKKVLELEDKFGISISHEDVYGGFVLVPLDDDHKKWFSDAIDRASCESIKAEKGRYSRILRKAKEAEDWLAKHPEKEKKRESSKETQ